VADTGGMSLEDALAYGQGEERPFRCFVHEDSTASASVNVLKNVWYCHACHASGAVNSKRTPKVEELAAMLEPEATARTYPAAFAELYAEPVYWLTRFSPWVCWDKGLGEDPFTGDATFPVHTPAGRFAGVGRRRVVTEEKEDGAKRSTRYLYPRNWSASRTLFGMAGQHHTMPVIVLLEGAADATSVWEVGAPGFATYGAGLHLPQKALLARYRPRVILLGFDMDEAGERAVTRGFKDLADLAEIKRVRWPAKDPGECTPQERRKALVRAVSATDYGVDVVPRWDRYIAERVEAFERYTEERAS